MGRQELAARVAAALSSVRQPTHGNPLISGDHVDQYAALAAHIADLVQASDITVGAEESDEEDVAFAFSNPDASAAGYTRHTSWQGDVLWGGNFEQARAAYEMGGSWFDANRRNSGVQGVTTSEWYREGFWQPSLVQEWSEAAFVPAEAIEWMTRSFNPEDAKSWRDAGFEPSDAFEWKQACKDTKKPARPTSIVGWRDAGFSPAEAIECINSKVSVAGAVEARDGGRDPSSVADLGPAGIPGRSWKNTVTRVVADGLTVGEFTAREDGWVVDINHPDDDEPFAQAVFDNGGRFQRAEIPWNRRNHTYMGHDAKSAKDIRRFVDEARRRRDAALRRR